ncbi:hypothetical protein [Tautonia sociabilis]|uniref:Uncharacterized protein n=1 Tax=Tautonia sociabilis TaxID=2080755 RepID=A0A432MME1_9BACT|nr:hypothetical protein [Tautonia sociabilis]RUL88286.1 hypothetical protein TsocGM_08095 [Tautonia sociabilis]
MLTSTIRAAALAPLVALTMLGTSAHSQTIDLRLPPFGRGAMVHRGPSHLSGRSAPHLADRGVRPARHVDHDHDLNPNLNLNHGFGLVSPGPGRFPGVLPPVEAALGYGGGPLPGGPGGFPIGAVPPAAGVYPLVLGPGLGGGCVPGASPVIGAVDTLIGQVAAFLQVFGPTVRCVPQGERIYADALALYESSLAFRQAALAGAPPCDLRRLHAAMEASCGRLVNRVNCIARGRTGPNIEQVRLIGALCRQIGAVI